MDSKTKVFVSIFVIIIILIVSIMYTPIVQYMASKNVISVDAYVSLFDFKQNITGKRFVCIVLNETPEIEGLKCQLDSPCITKETECSLKHCTPGGCWEDAKNEYVAKCMASGASENVCFSEFSLSFNENECGNKDNVTACNSRCRLNVSKTYDCTDIYRICSMSNKEKMNMAENTDFVRNAKNVLSEYGDFSFRDLILDDSDYDYTINEFHMNVPTRNIEKISKLPFVKNVRDCQQFFQMRYI